MKEVFNYNMGLLLRILLRRGDSVRRQGKFLCRRIDGSYA